MKKTHDEEYYKDKIEGPTNIYEDGPGVTLETNYTMKINGKNWIIDYVTLEGETRMVEPEDGDLDAPEEGYSEVKVEGEIESIEVRCLDGDGRSETIAGDEAYSRGFNDDGFLDYICDHAEELVFVNDYYIKPWDDERDDEDEYEDEDYEDDDDEDDEDDC